MNFARPLSRLTGILALSCVLFIFSLAVSVPRTYAATAIAVGDTTIITNTDGDTVRVRDGAGTGFAQIAEAHQGDKVKVVAGPSKDDKGNPWYKIEIRGGTGWVSAAFIDGANSGSASPARGSAPEISGYARITNTDGDALRVRSSASSDSSVLGKLVAGAIVKITGSPVKDFSNIWWYQVSGDQVAGWAMAQFLSQSQKPVPVAQPAAQPVAAPRSGVSRGAEPPASSGSAGKGSRVASVGLQYVGYHYVFGGATPRGFDCSGFIYYVLNKAGVSVGRDMYSQLNSGPRVSRANLMPGDLLFWSNTYKRGLSHSGIYIGNGKFVHAENEGTGVVISSMSNPYYSSRFTAAVHPR